jgi:hypothetical protein
MLGSRGGSASTGSADEVDAAKERQAREAGKLGGDFFDGGFATRSNLAAIKALGVKDAAFHERRGIESKR